MNACAQPFRIKICGLSTPQTLAAALDAGADMIGLVFHPRSPRFVTLDKAAELAALARGRAAIVALLVDPDRTRMDEILERVRPDWLQLHGGETPAQVAAIRTAACLPVMKAVGISEPGDIAAIAPYRAVADLILLDAKPPRDAAYPGGHGRSFDWRILAGLDPALRFMLSGGLDPANVGAAIREVGPAGVDVSTGVESAPGVKDSEKITAFVAAARAAAEMTV
ncbi:N-(5'-phosphoribosyl)anthranilate isomerase [Bosea sp. Leaf344]|uniref:phosphoribosylanthranilate isomerase n=1 Tax=Bosea sp. Leaf344 TaxID=1736346 RepID=UPI0006F200F5|nr:phosphoribosylanthranilate isomerase [Bosea sp. Leaf344]KQU54885.1 N-(5'-phosphoribosyl)anthranilate isomerase [Bosea sp. Leaf344]